MSTAPGTFFNSKVLEPGLRRVAGGRKPHTTSFLNNHSQFAFPPFSPLIKGALLKAVNPQQGLPKSTLERGSQDTLQIFESVVQRGALI